MILTIDDNNNDNNNDNNDNNSPRAPAQGRRRTRRTRWPPPAAAEPRALRPPRRVRVHLFSFKAPHLTNSVKAYSFVTACGSGSMIYESYCGPKDHNEGPNCVPPPHLETQGSPSCAAPRRRELCLSCPRRSARLRDRRRCRIRPIAARLAEGSPFVLRAPDTTTCVDTLLTILYSQSLRRQFGRLLSDKVYGFMPICQRGKLRWSCPDVVRIGRGGLRGRCRAGHGPQPLKYIYIYIYRERERYRTIDR